MYLSIYVIPTGLVNTLGNVSGNNIFNIKVLYLTQCKTLQMLLVVYQRGHINDIVYNDRALCVLIHKRHAERQSHLHPSQNDGFFSPYRHERDSTNTY